MAWPLVHIFLFFNEIITRSYYPNYLFCPFLTFTADSRRLLSAPGRRRSIIAWGAKSVRSPVNWVKMCCFDKRDLCDQEKDFREKTSWGEDRNLHKKGRNTRQLNQLNTLIFINSSSKGGTLLLRLVQVFLLFCGCVPMPVSLLGITQFAAADVIALRRGLSQFARSWCLLAMLPLSACSFFYFF